MKGFDESGFAIYSKSGFTKNLEESRAAELHTLDDVLHLGACFEPWQYA